MDVQNLICIIIMSTIASPSVCNRDRDSDADHDGGDCQKSQNSCNISKILNELLDGYDKGIRPFLNDRKPVVVKVGIWILSIDAINVIDMDFRIDLFFRQVTCLF